MIVQSPFEPDPSAALSRAVQEGLLEPGVGILVAVSGGADSMALAHALARGADAWGLGRIVAAHIDHRLRPESPAEAEWVRGQMEALGLPFVSRAVSVTGDGGPQAAAREARYRALERLRVETGSSLIATAHTADDQAETVLLRLARGTSPGGLGGIPARRGPLVRPLLTCRHGALEAWCRVHQVQWLEDPSNRSPRYDRVRVRRELLPLLEARFNPRVVEALVRLAALSEEDAAVLAEAASTLEGEALDGWGGLDCARLGAATPALSRRVLAGRLEALGARVEGAAVAALLGACVAPPGGRRRLTLPDGVAAERSLGRLFLWRGLPPTVETGPLAPGTWPLPSGGVLTVRSIAEGGPPGVPPGQDLLMRAARPGDRLGSRRLTEAWSRQGVPAPVRSRLPVLADADGRVIWAAGLGGDPALCLRAGPRWTVDWAPPEPRAGPVDRRGGVG